MRTVGTVGTVCLSRTGLRRPPTSSTHTEATASMTGHSKGRGASRSTSCCVPASGGVAAPVAAAGAATPLVPPRGRRVAAWWRGGGVKRSPRRGVGSMQPWLAAVLIFDARAALKLTDCAARPLLLVLHSVMRTSPGCLSKFFPHW